MKLNLKNSLLPFTVIICIILASCNAGDSDNKVIQFDDGSKIIKKGGITYYHYLFDDYVMSFGDRYFSGQIILNPLKNYSADTKVLPTKMGYYIRYAFDPNGYIAYYRIVETNNSDDIIGQRVYGEKTVSISEENAILYICDKNVELYFNTSAELLDYCSQNDINLGQWYYGNCMENPKEEILTTCNAWQIIKRPWKCYIVRCNRNDMFTGDIDRYCAAKDYLIFHIQIIENNNYRGNENPIIDYSSDVILKRKFKWQKLSFVNIYVDNYVIIDTKNDTHKIYSTKKEVEEDATKKGIVLNWIKI